MTVSLSSSVQARLAAEAEEARLLEIEWRGVRAEMKGFATR